MTDLFAVVQDEEGMKEQKDLVRVVSFQTSKFSSSFTPFGRVVHAEMDLPAPGNQDNETELPVSPVTNGATQPLFWASKLKVNACVPNWTHEHAHS